jgi:hypothetical protein
MRGYIIKKISTFISYYFESRMKKIINCIIRYDDGGEMSFNEDLSMFSHSELPL